MAEFPEVPMAQEMSSIYSEAVEKKRQNLLETAKKYGLYAEQTLRCSQELDMLIIEIQEQHFPQPLRAQM
ncbi:aspartyl-phosphate phosphatase Spo0E family protein [Sporolactobacillus sp. CPB3-1]|uniref:Aspartyl-phosphate phosphatase Spo0E family protein n=1 Tax=Sporolactobacillus mangiferae TaxID=2940498 RepID=A0ABT0M807_9BACL|nr:aspartyl-phosphate phosphatase Spo0E family protein [Sporolactobacillus mangiferae]MCL1630991.1 aspartyl-phosphate phosphatase Spo0E family protein [Sporolactobacillus mangiferae]